MKYVTIVIVLIVILGGIAYYKGSVSTYTAPEVVEKKVEVEVEPLEKRIENALNASSTQIEAEAKKAYDEKRAQLETEVELNVTRTYRAEIEKRESELEDKVSL